MFIKKNTKIQANIHHLHPQRFPFSIINLRSSFQKQKETQRKQETIKNDPFMKAHTVPCATIGPNTVDTSQ